MDSKQIFSLVILCVLLMLMNLVAHAQPTEPIAVECGTAIDGLFIEHGNTEQLYLIDLSAGTRVSFHAYVRGDFLDMRLNIGVWSPSGQNLNGNPEWHIGKFYEHPIKSIEFDGFDETGVYEIMVLGGEPGAYRFEVGCTLPDGTVIEPGEVTFNPTVPIATFSGYGFLGLEPVDFAGIPEIQMSVGQVYVDSMSATSNEPSLYRYVAKADEMAKLSINRTDGDLAIGVAVLRVDDNALIFFTSMTFANSLTTSVTFPEDGSYVIGIFRLDVQPNRIGTSGTFALQLR